MQPGQTILFLLVMVGFLVGCGQKGPLYREAPASDGAVSEQTSRDEQNSSEQADDQ